MINVALPEFHPGQVRAWQQRSRFYALRAGRRWGKSEFGIVIAADAAAKGAPVGWFAPEHKFITEAYNELSAILAPVRAASNKTEGIFRTITGGSIEFWSLENELAGRSRKYKLVIIDEAAFAKTNLRDIWRLAIRPTLVDYRGSAIVLSNTRGVDPDNWFYQICNDPEMGWTQYHAPTHENPYMPADELAQLKAREHPLVYSQEYLAEFVDWSGAAFFSLDSLLQDGGALPFPPLCDYVFAVIDSAVKTGTDNDGTAVVYYATAPGFGIGRYAGAPLRILDWDITQIEGALLESWLPSVFDNLEALAKRCGARMGSLGVWIEDKSSGMVLLQQAQRRGWPVTPIESKLTSMGKDERALNCSGYVYRGEVKLTQPAHDKTVTYKGETKNHLITQVCGFRLAAKDAARRADDLLDCFTYGAMLALGGSEGF